MYRFLRLYRELKRRNVFRAGAAYLLLAWLSVQVADILLGAFAAPEWAMRSFIVALTIGFPVTLVLSWIYEITVEGVKRTDDVLLHESITSQTGRTLDFVVIGLLSVAVAIFAIDRFVWRQFEDDADGRAYDFSVAVLPFTQVSDDIPSFFGQLSGDVTRLLQRSNKLRVASVDAIEALPTVAILSEIATRLGVRYVVSGIVNSESTGISLSVSLFDQDSNDSVWTSRLENAHSQKTINFIATTVLTKIGAEDIALPAEVPDPEAYELYLRARQQSTIESERGRGEELYREALAIAPRFSLALAGLCNYFVRQYEWTSALGDFEEAERYCFRAWTVDASSAEVQLALGDLYESSGQIEKARESYSAALKISPHDLDGQVSLAETYHIDQPELAENQLKKIVRQHPGSPRAYISLQLLYFKQGKYAAAADTIRWAVRLRPDDLGIKYRLTSDLALAGMFGEAKQVLEEILESGSEESGYMAKAENNLATVLFFEGDYSGAAKLYRAAINRAPEDPLYYRNLGDALWHLDGKESAQATFLKAIELLQRQLSINPDHYFAFDSLVVAYASVGDEVSSNKCKTLALEAHGDDPHTHYDIAVAASRLEDMESARYHAAKARELGYPVAWLKADPDIRASGASFESRLSREK